MNKYTTYILHSKKIDRYYTGSTSMLIKERLQRHNSNHNGFTGKTNDWEVVLKIEFDSVSESRAKEKEIKSRGAKRYLEGMKR